MLIIIIMVLLLRDDQLTGEGYLEKKVLTGDVDQ